MKAKIVEMKTHEKLECINQDVKPADGCPHFCYTTAKSMENKKYYIFIYPTFVYLSLYKHQL